MRTVDRAWMVLQAEAARRTRTGGRLTRVDAGPLWLTAGAEPLSRRAPSLTLRAAGRQWTLGLRLPGWVE